MKPLVSQVFPSELFWRSEESNPIRDEHVGAPDLVDGEDYESVSVGSRTNSPVTRPLSSDDVPNQPWPIVQPPQGSLCEASVTPYSSVDDSIPMVFVSISNVALQYVLLFRDFILSVDEKFVSGEVKFGAVAVLSVVTAVGYTLLTLEEASIRVIAFAVSSVILLPFVVIGLLFGAITHNLSLIRLVMRVDMTLLFVIGSSLQNIVQIATGVIAANHMMTNTSPNLPKVNVIVGEATFGLNHFAEKTVRHALSFFPKGLI